MDYLFTLWIVLIPLAVFLFTGLAGSRFKPVVSGLIGTSGLMASFVLSLITAYNYFFVDGISGTSLSHRYSSKNDLAAPHRISEDRHGSYA